MNSYINVYVYIYKSQINKYEFDWNCNNTYDIHTCKEK